MLPPSSKEKDVLEYNRKQKTTHTLRVMDRGECLAHVLQTIVQNLCNNSTDSLRLFRRQALRL